MWGVSVFNHMKKFLKSNFSKVAFVYIASLLIAIFGIVNNIEREKQKIFKNMQSKIKIEVEKELYKELSDKFSDIIRNDLKREYRDFVKHELNKSLRDDTFRTLKHQIDNEGVDLCYKVVGKLEYKKNGESINQCEVVVDNLDKIFNEELHGLFKQIFGNDQDNYGILLVFSDDTNKLNNKPEFKIEKGLNDQIIIQDNKLRDFVDVDLSSYN